MNTGLLPQLWLCLDRRVDAHACAWLERSECRSRDAMAAAFFAAPRHVGRADVAATPNERLSLGAVGVGAGLAEWRVDDLARATLLLAWGTRLPTREREALAFELYRAGDSAAKAAVLRFLPLSPDAELLLPLALDATRAPDGAAFEALACANTYPAGHFGDESFAELVLRALSDGVRLERIFGLPSRSSVRLRRLVSRFAETRRATGRGVPDDVALLEVSPCDSSTVSLI
jgi:hypothetical protein